MATSTPEAKILPVEVWLTQWSCSRLFSASRASATVSRGRISFRRRTVSASVPGADQPQTHSPGPPGGAAALEGEITHQDGAIGPEPALEGETAHDLHRA